MANKYQNFKNLAKESQILRDATEKAYQGDKSPHIKQIAGRLFNTYETSNYGSYLSRDPSSEEVYNVIAKATEQKGKAIEYSIKNDLEGILNDAPNDLIEFASKNIAPVRTNNEKYSGIAKAHGDYMDARKIWTDYNKPESRKEARKKLLKKVDKVYSQRYKKDKEYGDLMKDMARFSDVILGREYMKIIKDAETNFNLKLNGNVKGYLYENVKNLGDKSSFINYILTGDETQLVQTAVTSGNQEHAEMINEELRRDIELQGHSPEEARNILMQQYGSEESGPVIRRQQGIQRPAQRIRMQNYAA
jgi:hypothetical protein